jgi:hydroxymethylglutaryl-CoA lyase
MQGLRDMIPTQDKIDYLNLLLKVGFDTLDFGSFVSPKAIPQMADTAKVVEGLDLASAKSKLLAIVGNTRGAKDAAAYEAIRYLGFPFSISNTFLQRNLNSGVEDAFERVAEIQNICLAKDKELVVYISMAFGNPYGDPWDVDIVGSWAEKLGEMGVKTIALADTIGVAQPKIIRSLFSQLIPALPQVELGAHFHSTPDTWLEKVDAAYLSGCKRYDGALMGYGGCPMAKDDLTGNMATENMMQYFNNKGEDLGLDLEALRAALRVAMRIMPGAEQRQEHWLLA